MLYDPERISGADDSLLDPQSWARYDSESQRGGRGSVWFVSSPDRHDGAGAVLRHYRRGGMVARVLGDRYLYRGRERTRPFSEFRVLQQLLGLGLPVPRPWAAGFRRRGLFYRADILLELIPDTQTLAQCAGELLDDPSAFAKLGELLGRFQAAGAFHADLNAHNILFDGQGGIWLIDFDRGEIRQPSEDWQDANLARLQRSLDKIGIAADPRFPACWSALVSACIRRREAS